MQHPLHDFVSHWIKRTSRELDRLCDRRLEAYGLTASQVNVLEQLWSYGDGMTQKELHEKLGIRPASLTNLLDALVTGGWVVRVPDSRDARVKRIILTEAGQAQRDVCLGIMQELEDMTRQRLTEEEVSTMLELLRRTHGHLPTEKNKGE
ncbi:MarR family winged helix-turn-helix transcriptional regulator [Paenibacillus sp. GCM10027628]|uniref:MarR family winged helix-turn-helix transcriptional regulator n=1 Tax=Paenibacillus sp. GCM10027628 TaxID=3273413 RepID=UPI0036318A80